MPVPFLFIGVGALTAAAGAGTTAKAVKDNSKAKRINDKANEKIMNAANKLDRPRRQCGEALEHLGREKVVVLNTSVRAFLNSFEKLKNVEFVDSHGLSELKNLHIDKNDGGCSRGRFCCFWRIQRGDDFCCLIYGDGNRLP